MYIILGTRSVIRKFETYMQSIPKAKHNKILIFLKNTPSGHPDHKMKFKKVGKNCGQYDLTEEARLIYSVLKKDKKVIIGFIGGHDEASWYLRNRC